MNERDTVTVIEFDTERDYRSGDKSLGRIHLIVDDCEQLVTYPVDLNKFYMVFIGNKPVDTYYAYNYLDGDPENLRQVILGG